MLSEQKINIFRELIKGATSAELTQMSVYLKESIDRVSGNADVSAVNAGVKKISILFGTETGNSKKLATDLAAKARKNNIVAKVIGTDQYRLADLPKEEFLFIIISTHGEGDPPDAARKFYDHIHNVNLKLDKLNYSVLALGDSSYPLFCKTGEDVDKQLQLLGAKQVVKLRKCDVDYDEEALKWMNEALQFLLGYAVKETIHHAFAPSNKPAGKQVASGKVLSNIILNGQGSAKETHHIELAVEGVQYQCGDSVGIVPENAKDTVAAILSETGIGHSTSISYKNEKITVADLLTRKINIVHLTERMVKLYAETFGYNIPAGRHDLQGLVTDFPVNDKQLFLELLIKMNAISPRLYTIASSPTAHEGEIHLLVEKDMYYINGQARFGLCSDYLSSLPEGAEQQFFIQVNKRFRLPVPDKDIIMIGPGTGIAAFRSFLAEREVSGATGKNWLFFGEESFTTDFLYQTEIQNWYESGLLTKVNVAFSGEQEEKIYVQHRILEHGEAVYDWIQRGAHIYICGQKHPMGVEVEKALATIIELYGRMTIEEAGRYLEVMKEEGRLEKDVY